MDHCNVDLFADDATIHTNGKTKSDIEPKLQHDVIILITGLKNIK